MESIEYNAKGQDVCAYLPFLITTEQVAIAYNEAAIKHFGEFARLNTIND